MYLTPIPESIPWDVLAAWSKELRHTSESWHGIIRVACAEHLRYNQLNNFDRELNHLDSVYHFTSHPHQIVSEASDASKLLVCERGPLLFVFNFHPDADYTDLKVRPHYCRALMCMHALI